MGCSGWFWRTLTRTGASSGSLQNLIHFFCQSSSESGKNSLYFRFLSRAFFNTFNSFGHVFGLLIAKLTDAIGFSGSSKPSFPLQSEFCSCKSLAFCVPFWLAVQVSLVWTPPLLWFGMLCYLLAQLC